MVLKDRIIEREEYLKRLISWKDEKVIKVITGIRRCGKSTLLKQYEEYLLRSGIKSEQIISINLEDLKYEELLDYKALNRYIEDRLCHDGMTYILIDEIQNVSGFEKVVDLIDWLLE